MNFHPFLVMKSAFSSIPLAFLACCLPAFAFPAGDDPEFKKIFEIQEDVRFISRFGAVLLDIPAAELPRFRETLTRDLSDKKLPQRHAFRALGLTDTRWAEADTTGFIAATKAGLKNPHQLGLLRATCLLLESDVDAGIQAARDFEFSYATMEPFSILLATKDPPRAFAFFTERAINSKTSFSPVPMFLRWSEIDAAAAWSALNSLADNTRLNHHLPTLRASVSAHLARRDLPTALRLIDSLDSQHTKAETTRNMIAVLTKADDSIALDICRKIDTKDAWLGFARSLQTQDDRETLRILLKSLPPAHQEEGLAAFFTRNDDPVMPAFRNARLIPLLEDPGMRRKILIALAGAHTDDAYEPMPAPVIDAALGMTADILASSTPLPLRKHLLRYMLGRDPMKVLPWILSLSDAEWNIFHEDIMRGWAASRHATDIPSLLSHEHSRAKAIGIQLLDKWMWSSPADALTTAVRHAPGRIAKEMNFCTLHKQTGEDFLKAETSLDEIADPVARAAALRAYVLWSVGNLAPELAKTMAGNHIRKFPDQDSKDILGRLAMRQEEEFDQAISAIPGLPDKDKDEMRGLRARGLLLKGEEKRAFQLLKDIRADSAFFSALYYLNNNGQVAITRWDDFLSLIAARPDAEKQKDVIDLYTRKLVENQNEKAMRFITRIRNKELRTAFSTAVTLRMPPTKDGNTWERAVELGLATEAGRTMGMKAIRVMANQDPKIAIKTLLKSGPNAMRQEFVQPVMGKLVTDDPAAAFAMLKSFPTQISGYSLSDILREWSLLNSRAACDAALSLIGENPNDSLVSSTVDSWFRQDADSARTWVLSLPEGKGRQAALTSMVRHISSSDPDQAAKVFLSEFKPPLPDSTANQIARDLARSSYPAACQFLLGLDGKIEVRQITSTGRDILRGWLAADPESASQFLSSMPESDCATQLRGELAANPKTADTTGNATQPDTLKALRDGTIHQQILSDHAAEKLREAVIQPANQSSYLSDYCVFLLRRNRDADIPGVLGDARNLATPSPESRQDTISAAITACLQHLQKNHPQRIPAFLDSLAAVSPEWLENAVAALWSPHFARQGNRQRISPLMAASLLRLPPEKRSKLIAGTLAYTSPIPAEWLSFFTLADQPNAENEPPVGILLALAKEDLPSALRAATQLPSPQGDPMIRSILAAFPSREEAAKAIRTVPPGNRPRVEAWHDALNPQAK